MSKKSKNANQHKKPTIKETRKNALNEALRKNLLRRKTSKNISYEQN